MPQKQIVGFNIGPEKAYLASSLVENNEPPEIIRIFNRIPQLTAIAYDPTTNQPIIGYKAAKAEDSRFFSINELNKNQNQLKQHLTDYISTIYIHLKEERVIDAKNTDFYFSYPSDWSLDQADAYYDCITSAGIPNFILVPRIVVLLWHHFASVDLNAHRVVGHHLIINLSYAHFSFTLLTSEISPFEIPASGTKPIQIQELKFNPDPFGSFLIDKAILRYTLEHSPDQEELEQIFETSPFYRQRCEEICRQAKEEYFNNPDDFEDFGVPTRIIRIKRGLEFEPGRWDETEQQSVLDGLTMRKILDRPLPELGNMSWPDKFRSELLAVEEHLNQHQIELGAVLLTGDDSRMGFIRDILQEFITDTEFIDLDDERKLAQGLALWGKCSSGLVDQSDRQQLADYWGSHTRRPKKRLKLKLKKKLSKTGPQTAEPTPAEIPSPISPSPAPSPEVDRNTTPPTAAPPTETEFTEVENNLIELMGMDTPMEAVQKMATILGYGAGIEDLQQRYQAAQQSDPIKTELQELLERWVLRWRPCRKMATQLGYEGDIEELIDN